MLTQIQDIILSHCLGDRLYSSAIDKCLSATENPHFLPEKYPVPCATQRDSQAGCSDKTVRQDVVRLDICNDIKDSADIYSDIHAFDINSSVFPFAALNI